MNTEKPPTYEGFRQALQEVRENVWRYPMKELRDGVKALERFKGLGTEPSGKVLQALLDYVRPHDELCLLSRDTIRFCVDMLMALNPKSSGPPLVAGMEENLK